MKPERKDLPGGGHSDLFRLPDDKVRILVYDKDGKLVETVYGTDKPTSDEKPAT